MITSSNWAVKRLGGSSWKFHYGAYTVFYLVVLHTLYFLFMHYMVSFHRPVADSSNWFRYPFLVTAALVLAVQMSAFFATMRGRIVARHDGQPKAKAGRALGRRQSAPSVPQRAARGDGD